MAENRVSTSLGTTDTVDGPAIVTIGRLGLSSGVKVAVAVLSWSRKFLNVSEIV